MIFQVLFLEDTSSTAARSPFPRRGWLTRAVCFVDHLKMGSPVCACALGECAMGAGLGSFQSTVVKSVLLPCMGFSKPPSARERGSVEKRFRPLLSLFGRDLCSRNTRWALACSSCRLAAKLPPGGSPGKSPRAPLHARSDPAGSKTRSSDG